MSAINNSRPEFNTIVFQGKSAPDLLQSNFTGLQISAWMSGHGLEDHTDLLEFVQSLADGQVDQPEDAAQALLDKLQGRWRVADAGIASSSDLNNEEETHG